MLCCQTCQELIAINKSLMRMQNESLLPAFLQCDNKAAVICAQTSGSNRLRHMTEVHMDYVQECVKYN